MIDLEILKEKRIEVVRTLRTKADKLLEYEIMDGITVDVDLASLPNFQSNTTNKRNGTKYYADILREQNLEHVITEKRGAVYYFHLPQNVKRSDIVEAILKCKPLRSVPSLKGIDKRDSKVLYVGSIKSGFYTRFYQHLGYGTRNTAALQLIHWALPHFTKVRMTYFPIEYSNLALHTQMEIAMCKTVTPMIGRMERDTIN